MIAAAATEASVSAFAQRARLLTERGIPVTPVFEKRAFLPDFPVRATTDANQINLWAQQYPNHNTGAVAKPELGGFWFFEIDSPDVLKRLSSETGQTLPPDFTLIVKSRPGRGHFYFKQSAASLAMGNISQTYVKNGDWSARVENQYVVGPKSINPVSGAEYEMISAAAIIEAPAWLINWCLSQKVTKTSADTVVDIPKNGQGLIAHGQIHGYMLTQAGKLRSMGLDRELIESGLLELVHKNCAAPLDDSKVIQMAKSVCDSWEAGRNTDLLLTQTSQTNQQPTAPLPWSEITALEDSLSPVLPFKKDFLPVSIQPWVTDVAERMSVPLEYAGICALVVLAGVTGRRAFVHPKANDKDWKESICLSGAVVASSGRTKTPTWKTFMNPVIEVEKDWQRERDKKVGEFLEALKSWETIQKQNKELLKTNKDAVIVVMPEPTEPEHSKRIMLNDSTPEKMHDMMKDNPAGVFYYRDELSSWFAELDKEGREAQRGLFLAAMNGDDPYSVDRIGREGGFAMMCATVFGGVQPDLLRDFLSEARNIADGTVPRFHLIVWPDEVDLPKIDRRTDDAAKAQFRNVVRTLAAIPPESIFLHFDNDAQQEFYKFIEANSKKISVEENTGKQSHLAKYAGALPKIAALLQLVDLVGLGGKFVGNYKIDLDHMRRALGLIECLESHMHRIYDAERGPVQQTESRLVRRLKQHDLGDGFSARDIKRKHWAGLRETSAETMEMALETLAEHGYVRQLPAPNVVGRPTLRWEINPALTASQTVN